MIQADALWQRRRLFYFSTTSDIMREDANLHRISNFSPSSAYRNFSQSYKAARSFEAVAARGFDRFASILLDSSQVAEQAGHNASHAGDTEP